MSARFLAGRAPFCGRCRNPFGIVQDGGRIEVGPPGRAFGENRLEPELKALCPGVAGGAHDVWVYSAVKS